MFIHSGTQKGKKITAVSQKNIRPTSQMIKEAMFEILSQKIDGAVFLDLFAGFGTIGIEALSRGASYVFFVDKNKFALKTVRENLSLTGFSNCECILSESLSSLKRGFKRKGEQSKLNFDIIFIDPPYDYKEYDSILESIFREDLLAPKGLIIVEHYHKTEMKNADFAIFRKEKYGQTRLTFFEKKENADKSCRQT